MNNEKKLELKIQALTETYTRRVIELDDKVADLRVALTEQNERYELLLAKLHEIENANGEEEVSDEK